MEDDEDIEFDTPPEHYAAIFRLLVADALEREGFVPFRREGTRKTPERFQTMGLSAFDHPEFVVLDVDSELAEAIIGELGDRVAHGGERFDACDEAVVDGLHLRFVDVHPEHVERGLVAVTQDQIEARRTRGVPYRMRQVLLDDDFFCCTHRNQPRLDAPERPRRVLPKDATRRRARRRRNRRRR
jgi:hypothetical protein